MRPSVHNQGPLYSFLFSALAATLFFSGCSSNESPSTVQLHFPDWKAMRKADLERQSKISSLALDPTADPGNVSIVAVNVTGAGISQPKLFIWDRQDNSAAVPPSSISIPDVPKGGERLVQVLAVYEGTGSMQFYYADSVVNVAGDSTAVDVTLTNVASASSVVEGNVEGRFLPTANQGYTGVFHYRFAPPGGKPSMVVHQGEMFAGWARLFSLSSTLLTYSKIDGTPLFPADFVMHNASASLFSVANPERAISAKVPPGYKERNDGGTTTYTPSSGKRAIAGFFGAGTQGIKRVCYSATTEPLAYYYADAAHSIQVKWNGTASATGANEAYIESIAGVGRGGSGATSCAQSGTEWEDFLTFYHRKLGEDGSLAMQGPFKAMSIQATYAEFIKLVQNANTVTVKWDYLPAARAAIGGVGVFYRFGSSANTGGSGSSESDFRSGDGFRCNDLKTLANPFTEIKLTGAETSVDLNNITAAQFGNLQVVVCPINPNGPADKPYFASGVSGYGYSAPTLAIATNILIMGPKEDATQAAYSSFNAVCEPVWIFGATANGQLASFPSGTGLNFSSTGTSLTLHHSANCSDAPMQMNTALPTVSGSNTFFLYRKINGTGPGSSTLAVNAGTLGTKSISIASSDQPVADKLRWLSVPSSVTAQSCYPVMLSLWNSAAGTLARDVAPIGYAPLKAGGPFNFYSENDPACSSTPLTSISFSGSPDTALAIVFMKYTGLEDGTLLDLSSTLNAPVDLTGVSADPRQVTVHQPGAPVQLQVMAPFQVRAEECVNATLAAVDSHFQQSPIKASDTTNGSALGFSIAAATANSYLFYSGYDCSGTSVPSLSGGSIAVGTAASAFSFRRITAGPSDIIATPANAVSLLSKSTTIDANQPAIATKYILKLPGQSYVSGNPSASGSASAVILQQYFPITVIALTPLNHVADGTGVASAYSAASMPVSTTTSGLVFQQSTVSFSAGIATVMAKVISGSAGGSVGITTSVAGGLPSSDTINALLADAQPTVLQIYMNATIIPSTVCQPMLVSFEDASGISLRLSAAQNLTFSSNESMASNFTFSQVNDCSGPTGQQTFTTVAGARSMIVYYKTLSSPSSATLRVTAGTLSDGIKTISIASGTQGSFATDLQIFMPLTIKSGSCLGVMAATTDTSGRSQAASSDVASLSLTSTQSGGAFYSDDGCNTPLSIANLTALNRNFAAYFKAGSSTGSFNMNASGNGLTSVPFAFTVNP
jgi:hypothetical protein